MTEVHKGLGKCISAHLGSFGYPGRPTEPYKFCSQCGLGMVWQCPKCGTAVPDDSAELTLAKFCRECGAGLFEDEVPDGEGAQDD